MSLAACGNETVETNVTEPTQAETIQTESVESVTEETSETIVSESEEESSEDMTTETVETSEEQTETDQSVAEEPVVEKTAAVDNSVIEQSAEPTVNEATGHTTLYTISNTDSVGTATVNVNVYDRPSTDGIIIGTIEANEPIYCLCKIFDNGWHIIDTSSYDIPYEYGFVDPSIVSNPKADAMTTHFPESSFWTLSVTINSDGTTTITEIW